MPKVNTLYTYFSKSPAPNKPKKDDEGKSNKNSPTTPKPSPKSKNKTSTLSPSKQASTKSPPTSPECPYNVGDLVWAKLEGYPWWPSLVCPHPVSKVHFKRRPSPHVHVQFFDDPPSRSWIKIKCVKAYRGGESYTTPPSYARSWKKACEMADKALDLKQNDRTNLVTELLPSDDESDKMEVDGNDNSIEEEEKEKNGNSEDENLISEPRNKRRRIVIASDDSEDEYKPNPKANEDSDDDDDASSGVHSQEMSQSESEQEPNSPIKKKRKFSSSTPKTTKRKRNLVTPSSKRKPLKKFSSPAVNKDTKSKLASFAADDSLNKSTVDGDGEEKSWTHLKYDFLQEDKIKDIKKRDKDHPDYDPKTLHVPESFKSKLTPALRQWWEMKSQYFDVILFFKVGTFYEMYHMDAVIAVKELGLIYMKGDYAHAGFPEQSYGRFADIMVQKGYKVARIEQTETPQMMEDRCKKMTRCTKFDRVVNREICRITTKGTRTCSVLEREELDTHNSYLLAVAEKFVDDDSSRHYGVCFVDTSVAKFHLGQFEDDRYGSRFRTLISHYTPSQILYEKGKLSQLTQQIIAHNLFGVLKEPLVPKTEFWDATKTLKFLSEGKYFPSAIEYPKVLKSMLDPSDSLGLTARKEYELAIKSLGACTWYLAECKLEHELLSLKVFEKYEPLDILPNRKTETSLPTQMVLDGITLHNLDVIQNSASGRLDGTLLQVIDHCHTPFGKRLLRQWLCAPLCNINMINDRLNAIDDLRKEKTVFTDVCEMLRKLPDLERLLSKIHTQGSRFKSTCHPDGRAVFFHEKIYSKRKIEAFLSALSGFRTATEIVEIFEKYNENFTSSLLRKCVTLQENGGQFPNLADTLDFFDKAFDHEKAKAEGKIIPADGVDDDYDNAMKEIKEIHKELDDYLEEQKKVFGCKVVYFGSAKNRFQIEVPESACGRATEDHEVQSQKKGFKRYWTSKIKQMLAQMIEAENHRDSALQDIMRRIFARFAKDFEKWELAVQWLSTLDVLVSLSEYSKSDSVTRPEIVNPDGNPFIEIRNGCHPCMGKIFGGDNFIPNDTIIGMADGENDQSSARIIIVTGPNMGGKSTLMRQVGLIVILAQMGCYVPAEKCRLTPVDRIFTRLGASDRIMSGESTFFVELSETAAILSHATKNSLVLVDELGRGTATYDGTAIASAVVRQLVDEIQCRTLFSTHYHALVDEFKSNSFIKLGHMSCMVENENEEDPTEETITFLYKLASGACPKSYGFNAAGLAGIPDEVIKVGYSKAKDFEKFALESKLFRFFLKENTSNEETIEIENLLKKL